MSSQGSLSFAMPSSLPPPIDLASYSRSMHLHTKRQMEAANMTTPTRRGGRTTSANSIPSLPNGPSSTSSTSSRSPNAVHDCLVNMW
ncbi:hypothetical protein F5X96DRAFT_669693 [Biscogniauxia mediterranea]|nr:hypothetical protein F5X96DRAFT_669693 [Biscogniauxia mediterranea]